MPRSPAELIRRTTEVVRSDGLAGVVSKTVAWIGRLFYARSDYLVFEHDLRPTQFTPRATDLTVTTVGSPAELARLPEEARGALEAHGARLTSHLESGGMVFCVVVDGRLAHQCWVGTRRSPVIDPIAALIDYDRIAYLGAGETAPEFRGQGMLPLALCRICDVLRARGFARAVATVSPDNGSSIRGITKAGFQPAGRGMLVRCLGRYSWIFDSPAGHKER